MKIAIIGASVGQVKLCLKARELGYKTICFAWEQGAVCKNIVDKFYPISIFEKNKIIEICRDEKIDGIVSYASDMCAEIVAYVADQLQLPGCGSAAVKIMSEKDLFRGFLHDNNFNTPMFCQYADIESFKQDVNSFTFPIMIKPVDSFASRGVSKVYPTDDFDDKFNRALQSSKIKRVIVEEFIDVKGCQLHGDAFVHDGKVQFIYLGDHHFSSSGIINNLAPISTTFPSKHAPEDIYRIEAEIQRFITCVGYRNGGINIEVRLTAENKIYLIEVAPRSGGNLVPTTISYASGFDFLEATILTAIGEPFRLQSAKKNGFYMQLIIRVLEDGIFNNVEFCKNIQSRIKEVNYFIEKDEQIESVSGVNASIGVAIIKFDSMAEMQDAIANYNNLYKVTIL